jgi:hypothetical protein
MRKISIVFFIVIFSGFLRSQETLPFYQQYLLEGDFLFNPALYGKTDDVVLNLNYQKQFSQFDQSPNVQSIGMHANVFDRVGAGLSFFQDQNGPISSNGISGGGLRILFQSMMMGIEKVSFLSEPMLIFTI